MISLKLPNTWGSHLGKETYDFVLKKLKRYQMKGSQIQVNVFGEFILQQTKIALHYFTDITHYLLLQSDIMLNTFSWNRFSSMHIEISVVSLFPS